MNTDIFSKYSEWDKVYYVATSQQYIMKTKSEVLQVESKKPFSLVRDEKTNNWLDLKNVKLDLLDRGAKDKEENVIISNATLQAYKCNEDKAIPFLVKGENIPAEQSITDDVIFTDGQQNHFMYVWPLQRWIILESI